MLSKYTFSQFLTSFFIFFVRNPGKPGYVYLIHSIGTNRYKIGRTVRHPEERLKELNRGQSPYPLELIHFISVNNVYTIEKELHGKFQQYRAYGEWFEFTYEYEIYNVIQIMNIHNNNDYYIQNQESVISYDDEEDDDEEDIIFNPHSAPSTVTDQKSQQSST
ncbi:GIY-YIG nuclease family protein [Sphaerospermopsis sp. FACHB-1094]|uniref:GIY-YIG nuclease family protein n=1 Tax=Sphaerospermopsis sp. FACHB-1094 TaxID=2692861 RepID=UPI001684F93D|nr:GIY-YIG nuclease family protein [Sphaerospermopsis sp. FACHB-1094]MBD2131023.1 GIY-YIG nuclease family protein [Sphaerospermopsis sp. FACHB-1094]